MTDEDRALHATRPSLLLRLRDPRDGKAWSDFVETYTPLVFAYCRRRGLQDSDVADVTQEVMAQVMRSIGEFSYDRGRGRFRDWLGNVTRTKLIRFYRTRTRLDKAGKSMADELLTQVEDPETDVLWTEGFEARVLEAALSRTRPAFEEMTWDLFRGSWLDGKPASQLSDEFAVPIESVYVAKSRVLKRLREEVASLADDSPILRLDRD